MSNNRIRSRQQSNKMAVCGMMVALSASLMLLGGIIPVATYCVPMLGGLLLLPLLLEYGKKTAWTAFAAVSIIILMLGIDKEAAFFYLFLGYYPILKWEIERISKKALRIFTKLLIFNLSFMIMYVILGILFNMEALIEEFSQMGTILLIVFMLMLNACMFLYDRLLLPMVYLYVNKIRPKLRFLH